MPHYYEHMWKRVMWGWKHHLDDDNKGDAVWGAYGPNYDLMDERVHAMIVGLTDEDWEIKSTTPITTTRYHTNRLSNVGGGSSTWAGGYGYGAPITVGVLVLFQRRVECTEEEMRERRLRKAAEAEAQREAAQRAGKAEHDRIMALPITRKDGFMKLSIKWSFNGGEYNTEAEAMSARETQAKRALAQ